MPLFQIGESAIGTVIGNAATGFINDCFGRRKRSLIMDRIVNKRSPQEVSGSEVSGDDVNTRLFCLNNNNGFNNNGFSYQPNCRTCSCRRDSRCNRQCNKCNNSNNNFGKFENLFQFSFYSIKLEGACKHFDSLYRFSFFLSIFIFYRFSSIFVEFHRFLLNFVDFCRI